MAKKQLRKSSDKIIAGVAGGVAEYLNADPTLIRLLFVLIMLLTAVLPVVLFYVIAWIIMPE